MGEQGEGSSLTEKNLICLVLRITRSQHQKGIILASSQYFSHWTSPLKMYSPQKVELPLCQSVHAVLNYGWGKNVIEG